MELLEHRGSRRSVRRRNDGAEGDGCSPWQVGDKYLGHERHDSNGERDGTKGKAGDRTPVCA
jgi:hypothetical protein